MSSALVGMLVWPATFLVAVIAFFFIFWKPISQLILRSKRIKAGRFEADTSSQESENETIETKVEQVQENRLEVRQAEPKLDEKIEHPKTLDEWRQEMIWASVLHDRKQTDSAYQEMHKLNHDPLSSKQDDILYFRQLHTLGDNEAIPRLERLLLDTEVAHEAHMALGWCYAASADFGRSSIYYSQALEKARNDDERSLAASHYSWALYCDDRKDRAIEILVEALSALGEDTHKVRLYERLADLYEKEGDSENRAFVLDKATELRPSDSGRIFKTAYAYSHSKYDDLSLLHYKNAMAIRPEDAGIHNNLGVQYDRLGMPIKSTACYREAERLGNTLASANLAYRLIAAGFEKEAEDTLHSTNGKEDIHPNVNTALSEIPKRMEKENEAEEKLKRSALKLRKFLLGFAEAKFTKGDALKSVAGIWKSGDGTLFALEVSGSKITATWKENSSDSGPDWKLEGEMFNNSAVVEFHKKEYVPWKSEHEYTKKGRGFLCCSRQGNTISFLQMLDTRNTKEVYVLVPLLP